MILQFKDADSNESGQDRDRVTGNLRNAMVCATPYLQNEFGDPQFFLRF